MTFVLGEKQNFRQNIPDGAIEEDTGSIPRKLGNSLSITIFGSRSALSLIFLAEQYRLKPNKDNFIKFCKQLSSEGNLEL